MLQGLAIQSQRVPEKILRLKKFYFQFLLLVVSSMEMKYSMEIKHDRRRVITENLQVEDVCGWYTINEQGRQCQKKKYLKYLHMPEDPDNVNFDLNLPDASERCQNAFKTNECIDSLLEWIRLNSKNTRGKAKLPGVDFVCYRGLLYRIMCAPFESAILRICAIKSKGSIYMCRFYTPEARRALEQYSNDEWGSKCTQWGYVFEKYMLADSPKAQPDPTKPISEMGILKFMYRSKVGVNSLLYQSEIDCLQQKVDMKNLKTAKLVELKTCRYSTPIHNLERHKMMKWWAQSCLANVDSIVCGFRDDEGFIRKIESFNVNELPQRAKGWQAPVCTVFLNDFLNFVKHVMADASESDVYDFVRENTDNFIGKKLPIGNDCYFLSEPYVEWLKQFEN